MVLDYSKIGLKSGLEIHQQLDTGKLFSRTPSYLRKDEADYVVHRKLHAVAGEEGEVDVAVEHEALLDKEFVYEGYDDTISLVELDEEPCQKIDEDALDVAIQICLLLNCKIYPVTQIMRKTVINGSNTSGFQRTVIIGHNGFVETSFGRVGIDGVMLEEDAARIVKKEKGKTIFRLDRLGIPLVEIATAADMSKPEQIKEAALKIGEILRACKVKRGIGTIRQDVNISTNGHERVEVKGFQDVKIMEKIVDKEIERQQAELGEGKNSREVRNALPNGESEFLRPMPGRARMYPETDLPLLRIGRRRIDNLKKKLPKLRGEVRGELKKKGLGDDMIELVLKSGKAEEFDVLMKVHKNASLVGKMVTIWRTELEKKAGKTDILSERVLESVLEKVENGEIGEGDVKKIMIGIVEGKSLDELVKGHGDKLGDDEVEEFVGKLIKEKPGLRENAYMGLVMKEFEGKVDARKVMGIIGKLVKK